jgi:hypothetical protein
VDVMLLQFVWFHRFLTYLFSDCHISCRNFFGSMEVDPPMKRRLRARNAPEVCRDQGLVVIGVHTPESE